MRIAIIFDHAVHRKIVKRIIRDHGINYSTLRHILIQYYLFGRTDVRKFRPGPPVQLPLKSQYELARVVAKEKDLEMRADDGKDDTVTENSGGANGVPDYGMDIEEDVPLGESAQRKTAKVRRECKTQPHSARKHHHMQQSYNQQLNQALMLAFEPCAETNSYVPADAEPFDKYMYSLHQ